MLSRQGLLSDAEASKIAEALFYIAENVDLDAMTFDGSFEDLFFVIERELSERIGIEISGKLHTGRSRNDMEHTMFRMLLREKLIENLEFHTQLSRALIDKIIHWMKLFCYTPMGNPHSPRLWHIILVRL